MSKDPDDKKPDDAAPQQSISKELTERASPPPPWGRGDRPSSPFVQRMPVPEPQSGFSAPPTPREPFGMLDLEEPPEIYGIDEVTVLARDPFTLFLYWEVTADGRAGARAALGGADGALIVRVVSVSDDGAGPETHTVDVQLGWDHGRRYLGAPRPGAHVTCAVGLLHADGRFAPIAHAPRIRVPWADPGPEGPVEWMEVEPSRSRGRELERPVIKQRGAGRPAGRVPLRDGGLASSSDMPTSPWRWQQKERS
jgi:hypothetical protein